MDAAADHAAAEEGDALWPSLPSDPRGRLRKGEGPDLRRLAAEGLADSKRLAPGPGGAKGLGLYRLPGVAEGVAPTQGGKQLVIARFAPIDAGHVLDEEATCLEGGGELDGREVGAAAAEEGHAAIPVGADEAWHHHHVGPFEGLEDGKRPDLVDRGVERIARGADADRFGPQRGGADPAPGQGQGEEMGGAFLAARDVGSGLVRGGVAADAADRGQQAVGLAGKGAGHDHEGGASIEGAADVLHHEVEGVLALEEGAAVFPHRDRAGGFSWHGAPPPRRSLRGPDERHRGRRRGRSRCPHNPRGRPRDAGSPA